VIIQATQLRKISWDDREDLVEQPADLLRKTSTAAWAFLSKYAHFLLRLGPSGMATLMRHLLSRYAAKFYHRHIRHRQRLENRYQSIICQEDAYLASPIFNSIRCPLKSFPTWMIFSPILLWPRFAVAGIEPAAWQRYAVRIAHRNASLFGISTAAVSKAFDQRESFAAHKNIARVLKWRS